MVYGHYSKSISYLPTPDEILYGIILAQINEFKSYEKIEDSVIATYVFIWKRIFAMSSSVSMSKPLTPKILSDPKHEFIKTLIYIYSMESFVFSEINKTSRKKD